MKFLVVLAVAVACVAADVAHLENSFVPIVKSAYEITPDGSYQYAYETGNGIFAQAEGSLKNPTGENPAITSQGAYKYTSPDGTPVELSYIADEEGFKPVGSHIPVSPPIPELIARSLVYIAANPPKVENKPAAFQG